MPQPYSFYPTERPIPQRHCPTCHLPMFLSRIEPGNATTPRHADFRVPDLQVHRNRVDQVSLGRLRKPLRFEIRHRLLACR